MPASPTALSSSHKSLGNAGASLPDGTSESSHADFPDLVIVEQQLGQLTQRSTGASTRENTHASIAEVWSVEVRLTTDGVVEREVRHCPPLMR